MKVLWVVNTPIDILGEKLYGNKVNGVWMDALLSDYRKNGGFDLFVATSAKVDSIIRFENDGVTFYAVPDNIPLLYKGDKPSNIVFWDNLIVDIKPDIVQVWGTEFSHGLCAIKSCKKHNIPSVIYMQGYLGSIARHYLAGISEREIKKSTTIRDFIKHDNILKQQKAYFASAEREKEEFSLSGRIICENKWCENSVKAVAKDIKIYKCPLSINETFCKSKWDIDNCERHSVICNASGYPLKGLHMLLKAIALLKNKYPDIKLCIPGTNMLAETSFTQRLRRRGYAKYIRALIEKLKIENNIVWLGPLSQEELAKCYLKANVFVLCSAIENHSSSLKEAMMVGVPCVASSVGGVPEYVSHSENGLLYRFEEYDIAAAHIEEIFEDDSLAKKLSSNARQDMLKLHENNNVFEKIKEIYSAILNER